MSPQRCPAPATTIIANIIINLSSSAAAAGESVVSRQSSKDLANQSKSS